MALHDFRGRLLTDEELESMWQSCDRTDYNDLSGDIALLIWNVRHARSPIDGRGNGAGHYHGDVFHPRSTDPHIAPEKSGL